MGRGLPAPHRQDWLSSPLTPHVSARTYPSGKGSAGSTYSCVTPVIHALPRTAGTIAGLLPTVVSDTIRPSKVEPIAEAWLIASPTCISPRAWSTAMRAESPVPVAERSSRPGATTTALRVTCPTPCHGSALRGTSVIDPDGVLRRASVTNHCRLAPRTGALYPVFYQPQGADAEDRPRLS